jgi:threonyl-tRNA synthetase
MKIKDALGRQWQLATIQLDFQMPQRFGLEYNDTDGARKTPIVIHRAILGSYERFMGILIEQFAGAFPLWLSPVQVTILAVSSKQNKYVKTVQKQLKELVPSLRVDIDIRDESVGKKIRDAQLNKVPYMLVLGEKEMKSGKISIRTRAQKDLGAVTIKRFVERLQDELAKRK